MTDYRPARRRALLTALGLSASLLLGGCASTGGAALSATTVAPYRQTLALQGSIGINYLRDGKRESLTGTFQWQQTPAATDVTLVSPTGQTVAVLHVTPAQASLQQSGQPLRTAADLDSLTTQTLGWSLPVAGLRDWLQGYATDAQGQRFSASPARNTVVTRDGWKVEYMTWQDEQATVPQPKRIELTRLGAGEVEELAIRIAIRPAVEE
ncbi:lipoprotein insertase outer membrane protein LolB [Pseudoduganella danionis]|uniref:Outer-membrane lipoprotein LolB n=1 Tax=Pseudoduganella danionis TaxID=1890295 RepID=A0ABW9SXI3_9BURK|nr:lipoprotein insertase outer membrane protein LolB [Pseudoduganella danionis]MTW35009.1 outer membrane lipoprotein LolB [Pseudoduganella danionis]